MMNSLLTRNTLENEVIKVGLSETGHGIKECGHFLPHTNAAIVAQRHIA